MRRKRRHDGHRAELPHPDDPLFRVACNEIAEQLAKSWRFKLEVIGIVSVIFVLLAVAVSGIFGLSISAMIKSQRHQFQQDARREITNARNGLEAEIAEQFKKENVQRTMETAAAKEASALLKRSVEPSIKDFQ